MNWSHERQILELLPEPRTTDTGATGWTTDTADWSHKAADTGATNDNRRYCSYRSHKPRQPMEPQATDTGATNDRYWSHDERQEINTGATSDQQILEPQQATGAEILLLQRYWSHRCNDNNESYWSHERQIVEPRTGATGGTTDTAWSHRTRWTTDTGAMTTGDTGATSNNKNI